MVLFFLIIFFFLYAFDKTFCEQFINSSSLAQSLCSYVYFFNSVFSSLDDNDDYNGRRLMSAVKQNWFDISVGFFFSFPFLRAVAN
jgi:high-affinity nickel permease